VSNVNVQPAIDALTAAFDDIAFKPAPLVARKNAAKLQMCVRVPPHRLLEVMKFLYRDPQCRFDQLCDLTCVDYLDFPDATERFGVTYSLLSLSHGHRLWAKCFVDDPDPTVPSVTGVWRGANWLEREVYDLFGIHFSGHPDLRRIVLWEGYDAHPLRKDYPLRGRGEREKYPVIKRDSA